MSDFHLLRQNSNRFYVRKLVKNKDQMRIQYKSQRFPTEKQLSHLFLNSTETIYTVSHVQKLHFLLSMRSCRTEIALTKTSNGPELWRRFYGWVW